MNRRSFFQAALLSIGALGFLSVAQANTNRRRGGGAASSAAPVLVDPKEPGAKAVNYVHDNADIKDKKLQIERQGVQFKDQRCHNCSWYDEKPETTLGTRKVAPCKMPFAAGKVVAREGWCSTWVKKS